MANAISVPAHGKKRAAAPVNPSVSSQRKRCRQTATDAPSSPAVDPRFNTADFSSDDGEGNDQIPVIKEYTQGASASIAAQNIGSVNVEHECSSSETGGEGDEQEDLLAALEEPSSSADDDELDGDTVRRAGSGKPGSTVGDKNGHDANTGTDNEHRRHKRKVLSAEKVARMTAAADRRGIVYISRIPPHMKPHKIRQLLEEHGEIGRVYCAPEDAALRRQRKMRGGNSGKNFTEGWVEFEDKRRAKRAACQLNGQPMGGRHRSAYRFDLWNLKYLPRFKWDHLTEEVSYQRAVREQKLAAEISAAKRERDFYLSRVDRAKGIAAQQERRAARAETGGSASASAPARTAGRVGAGGGSGELVEAAAGKMVKERHYGQRRPKADPGAVGAPELSGDVLAMLGGRMA